MVMVYALSTCPYCKMTKKFLAENDIQFDHTDVDLLEGEEREAVVATVKELSGGTSFPVIVLDDGEVIVGFNKARLAEKLGATGARCRPARAPRPSAGASDPGRPRRT